MIQLGTSATRFDPVHNLGTAVLRQALFDLERMSPTTIARLRAMVDEPGISPELRSKRSERWGEASDMRHELIEWLGTEDYNTVVGWSGFEPGGVRKAFDAVLEAQGSSKDDNQKRKRRRVR